MQQYDRIAEEHGDAAADEVEEYVANIIGQFDEAGIQVFTDLMAEHSVAERIHPDMEEYDLVMETDSAYTLTDFGRQVYPLMSAVIYIFNQEGVSPDALRTFATHRPDIVRTFYYADGRSEGTIARALYDDPNGSQRSNVANRTRRLSMDGLLERGYSGSTTMQYTTAGAALAEAVETVEVLVEDHLGYDVPQERVP